MSELEKSDFEMSKYFVRRYPTEAVEKENNKNDLEFNTCRAWTIITTL
jgi:hypothetical protein